MQFWFGYLNEFFNFLINQKDIVKNKLIFETKFYYSAFSKRIMNQQVSNKKIFLELFFPLINTPRLRAFLNDNLA